jgi:hypothetical protein
MDAAMTGSLFIFGLGYTAQRLARAYAGPVIATGRQGTLAFDDEHGVRAALAQAQFVLSSVPPDAEGDPVLRRYGDALPSAPWLGYLSSTAVYGDAQGAWVDETSPTVPGERPQRTLADTAWQQLGAHVFRLPGIYGPGRSALDRVREGSAQLIDKPGHVWQNRRRAGRSLMLAMMSQRQVPTRSALPATFLASRRRRSSPIQTRSCLPWRAASMLVAAG